MKMNHSTNDDAPRALEQLLDIMAKLRDKQYGCAWDKKQTFKTLTSHTLEEVYEVIDAVDRNDSEQLQDELGDLLFQVVFYAQIASEQAQFDFAAVAKKISDKLLRRHPHIFPGASVANFGANNPAAGISAEQVEVNWEAIKNQERSNKAPGADKASSFVSVLDDIPRSFPAIERAKKLQKRAASIGFDWPELNAVLAKLNEERVELDEAIAEGDAQQISHELGDILFTCINLARHLRVEPEAALRDANQRFEQRFRHVEHCANESGKRVQDFELEELDSFWNKAKLAGL